MEDFEQIKMDSFSPMDKEQKDLEVGVALIVAEIFQDTNTLDSIKDNGYKTPPMPEEIKKGRTQILDGVLSKQSDDKGLILHEEQELSEITKSVVASRVLLTFCGNEDNSIQYSQKLTNFDREVIDAVASLAPNMQIMTAATIFRMITGKDESFAVTNTQKKRVEASMERCNNCKVSIDITSQLTDPDSNKNEKLVYTGSAITFTSICHKYGRGATTYYKILDMPPFFRLAERLGKVVIIPVKLLDTPVSKTDAIISVQSFLFRELDRMKSDPTKSLSISWETVYDMTHSEGKKMSRSENKRTRESTLTILDFWIQEGFIASYESDLKLNKITFVL